MLSRYLAKAALIATLGCTGLPAAALTFILDFAPTQEANLVGGTANAMTPFDHSVYGFSGLNQTTAQTAILNAVSDHYLNYPTQSDDPLSPLPDGTQLNIDFEIGTIGVGPQNNDPVHFYIGLGETTAQSVLGFAYLPAAFFTQYIGQQIGSVFTDNIAILSPLAQTDEELINLIAGTTSHEIGHTLSLQHPVGTAANPGESAHSVMATGVSPSNMPSGERIKEREFSYENFSTLMQIVGIRPVVVPVPGSVALLGGACAILIVARRW